MWLFCAPPKRRPKAKQLKAESMMVKTNPGITNVPRHSFNADILRLRPSIPGLPRWTYAYLLM
jgi:hypothetical protein